MGICGTCPLLLNFTIISLLTHVVITSSCILGYCPALTDLFFVVVVFLPLLQEVEAPSSIRPGTAFDGPLWRAGSVGCFCVPQGWSAACHHAMDQRVVLLFPSMCRRVNRSWFQASWSSATTQGPRVSCPGGILKELAVGWLLRNVGSHVVCLPCYIFDACFICVESFSTIVLLSAVEVQGKSTD